MKGPEAKISGAELEVMEALWQSPGPMTMAQVRGALKGSG